MRRNQLVVSMNEEDIEVMNAIKSKKKIGHLFMVIGLYDKLEDSVLEELLDDDELINLFRRIKIPDYEINGDIPFKEE